MTWLRSWPKCAHMNLLFRPGEVDTGQHKYPYAYAVCAQCGRPILHVPAEYPGPIVRVVRRHIAWWHLGKEYEHAANTLLVRVVRG